MMCVIFFSVGIYLGHYKAIFFVVTVFFRAVVLYLKLNGEELVLRTHRDACLMFKCLTFAAQ